MNALWDAFARYPYLPRLRSLETLSATARQGANPITWQIMGFALADAVDPTTGRFAGLTTDGDGATVTGTTLVVDPGVASPQLAELAPVSAGPMPLGGESLTLEDSEGRSPADEALRRFYAMAKLDPERYQRDFAKLAAEVIANLAGLLGTDIEISVEVKATNPEGFPDHVTRTVTENAALRG